MTDLMSLTSFSVVIVVLMSLFAYVVVTIRNETRKRLALGIPLIICICVCILGAAHALNFGEDKRECTAADDHSYLSRERLERCRKLLKRKNELCNSEISADHNYENCRNE